MSDDNLARLELQIGRLLSFGVIASAAMLIAGLIVGVVRGEAAAAPVLRAGLMLLTAIPATRILASFADAVRRRDRLLSISTGIVLAILLSTVVYPYLQTR